MPKLKQICSEDRMLMFHIQEYERCRKVSCNLLQRGGRAVACVEKADIQEYERCMKASNLVQRSRRAVTWERRVIIQEYERCVVLSYRMWQRRRAVA